MIGPTGEVFNLASAPENLALYALLDDELEDLYQRYVGRIKALMKLLEWPAVIEGDEDSSLENDFKLKRLWDSSNQNAYGVAIALP